MKLLFRILKGIVTVLLVIILILVILQKVTKNKITLGNIYIFQVASESMVPDYQIGDVIVVKKVNTSELNVGDDVTYLGRESNLAGLTITHRIINKREDNNESYFVTKGTANSVEDPEITYNDIYGKVVYHTILFSFVGRLMENMVIYYVLFILVGISLSYEIVSSYLEKKEEKE